MRALIAALFLLAGCASVKEPSFAGRYKNACVPEAAAMAESLKGYGIQAKVLLVFTPEWTHAVSVYLYPSGDNRLWVWDSYWKSLRTRTYFDDPNGIATKWLRFTHPELSLLKGEFL